MLDQLGQISRRRAAIDRAEYSLISAARANGAGWNDVATALGLGSRQAAEQRFTRLNTRLEPDETDGRDDRTATPTTTVATAPREGAGSRSGQTRARLVLAAGQVLAERGYASTRIADIAARADLRAGSVYHHFRSKDELIEEVLRFGVVSAHRRVERDVAAVPPGSDPSAALTAAMSAHLQTMLGLDAVARAHAHAFTQLPGPMKDRIRPFRRAYGALWSEVVGAAAEAGVLRGDIDRYLLRLFVVNSVEAASAWAWRSHRTATELSSTIGTLILEGARGPTG
ncbi:hypothetical protein AD006_31600 (plasmid) [Pseudonocardia sp. EC080610-09]|nr:hypothetical protein AD006_31600 [Pseudonocardia sp. EC080610-09]